MRNIILDGSDEMPPPVFEGAIHITQGGKAWKRGITVL